MNQKIMLLALVAMSAAAITLPEGASALTPLHLNPGVVGTQPISGGNSVLSATNGFTAGCAEVKGTATFNKGGTTGTLQFTLGPNCGAFCPAVTTTVLPFDLVTLPDKKPGLLVTSNSGHFAPPTCFLKFEGTGLIGRIERSCGEKFSLASVDFNAVKHGVQAYNTVADTATEYSLSAAIDLTMAVTFETTQELVCT